ncbi:uncharacterized protein LOC144343761 [Saccoglossus kowalevskii]
MHRQNEHKQHTENMQLKNVFDQPRNGAFVIEKFKNNDDDIAFYTGFPDLERFKICFEYFGDSVNQITSPRDKLTPMNQFFLVMCRLRLRLFVKDLAERFNVSKTTVSRIFNKWVNLLYHDLKEIDIWPSRELVDMNIPQCFKDKYPATRVIIDATEMQSITYIYKEITKLSKLPEKLERGHGVMPDKGFDIQDQLAATGAILNIPPFVTAGQ